MITGAAQANCGILVIDVNTTAFERGWGSWHGTTKEHASVARALGVTQLVVAMNKMELVEYSQQRYDSILAQVKPYLLTIGFKETDITFVPISGLLGENLTSKATEERLTSWYGTDSPCLLELLDKMRLPQRNFTKPLRLTISEYFSQG